MKMQILLHIINSVENTIFEISNYGIENNVLRFGSIF